MSPCGAVQIGDSRGDEVGAEMALPQVLPQPRDEAGVRVGAVLAEVGQLAHFPQAADHARAS